MIEKDYSRKLAYAHHLFICCSFSMISLNYVLILTTSKLTNIFNVYKYKCYSNQWSKFAYQNSEHLNNKLCWHLKPITLSIVIDVFGKFCSSFAMLRLKYSISLSAWLHISCKFIAVQNIGLICLSDENIYFSLVSWQALLF